MLKGIFSRLLDVNQKELDKLSKIVDKVNDWDKKVKNLKDKEFIEKSEELKKRIAKGEALDAILPEAFALAREASWRAIGLRPYDVQIMAAITLHNGKIAEQKMPDLNAVDLKGAIRIIEGTARSMGIQIVSQ